MDAPAAPVPPVAPAAPALSEIAIDIDRASRRCLTAALIAAFAVAILVVVMMPPSRFTRRAAGKGES